MADRSHSLPSIRQRARWSLFRARSATGTVDALKQLGKVAPQRSGDSRATVRTSRKTRAGRGPSQHSGSRLLLSPTSSLWRSGLPLNEACAPPAGLAVNCTFGFGDSQPLGLGTEMSIKGGVSSWPHSPRSCTHALPMEAGGPVWGGELAHSRNSGPEAYPGLRQCGRSGGG